MHTLLMVCPIIQKATAFQHTANMVLQTPAHITNTSSFPLHMHFASPKQHRETKLFTMFWNTVHQPYMLGQKTQKQCIKLQCTRKYVNIKTNFTF
jgi:hypothetical protein